MKTRLVSVDCDVPACDTCLTSLPVVIGSGPDAGIRLHDRMVSRWHCRIDQIDGTFSVCDLGSVHGTFVNGTRISESPLMPGDVLGVGGTQLCAATHGEDGSVLRIRPELAWPDRLVAAGHFLRNVLTFHRSEGCWQTFGFAV